MFKTELSFLEPFLLLVYCREREQRVGAVTNLLCFPCFLMNCLFAVIKSRSIVVLADAVVWVVRSTILIVLIINSSRVHFIAVTVAAAEGKL